MIVQVRMIDRATGRWLRNAYGLTPTQSILLVLGLIGLAATISLQDVVIGILFVSIPWGLLFAMSWPRLVAEKIPRYDYECLECGATWSRRGDEPDPPGALLKTRDRPEAGVVIAREPEPHRLIVADRSPPQADAPHPRTESTP